MHFIEVNLKNPEWCSGEKYTAVGLTLFGLTIQLTDWPTESDQKRPRHPTEKVCKQVKEPTSSPVISIFFIQAHPKYYVCFTQ